MNSHIFKKITKVALTASFIGFLLISQLPTRSFAQAQANFSSGGAFLVGDHKQAGTQNWTTNLSNIIPGDQVAFKFTFLNISSVTAIAAVPSFSASTNGNTITVTGTIQAQNAAPVSNTITITAAPGYTIALDQMSGSFGGVGDVLPGASNVEYYATGLYNITGQSTQQPIAQLWAEYPNGTTVTQVSLGTAPFMHWTSTNATECHVLAGSGFSTGGATQGTNQVSPLAGSTTFSIQCTGPGGSVQANYTVTVSNSRQPTAQLWAEYPNGTRVTQVPAGAAPFMHWTSTDATECHTLAGAGFSTGGATSGQDQVSPLAGDTTFSIQCTGPGGSVQANYTVTVTQSQGNAPTVQTLSASGVGQNSATLNGSVNPNGASTNYWFEYGTSQSLGNSSGSQSIGSGTSQINVSYIATGLLSNTTYYFRIVAQNQYGIAQGSILSFTTSGGGGGGGSAPSVQTISAANVTQTSATLNGSVNPNGASTNYWFEYGTSQSLRNTTAIQSAGSGSSSLNVSATVSGLLANTSYYFRIDAQNQYGTSQGFILSFTTLAGGGGGGGCTTAPSVMTLPATGITANSAQVSGTVNINGCTNTYYWFEYGTSQSLGNTSAAQVTSGGTVNAFLSNLSSNTLYYFRITASNGGGTAQGSILSFTTSGGGGGGGSAPSVQTISAANVTQTSATLNGSVNPNGASANYWFEYGTTQGLGNTTGMQSAGSGNSLLNVLTPVSGLVANTTYYFRIDAQNQNGTVQGSILSFTTGSGGGGGSNIPPTVTTGNATGITQNSATVSGYINPNGFNTNYWFEYGTTQNLGNTTGMQSAGSGTASQSFNTNLSNLSQNTTYYYRIDAQNQYGTSYGNILSFVTSSGGGGGGGCSAPYAQTTNATGVNQNSAQLNGSVNPNNCQTNYWFEYGTSYNLGNSTGMQSAGSGSGSFNVTAYISGLAYNTTYYFRVNAQNSAGTSYGQILSFSTSYGGGCQYGNCGGYGNPPYVTTLSATNVSGSYATFNGSVSSNYYGGYGYYGSNTYTWFEYGTNMNALYQTTNSVYMGGGNYTQNFSQTVYNLNPGTTYYFRAAARNDYGTSYGQVLTVYGYGYGTGAPQVITNAATYVYNTSALLNGQVDANGALTNAWFEYGTTQNLGSQTTSQAVGSGTNYQNYSFALSALSPNTTYYFRAAAQNNSGTAYGQILSFTTGGGGGRVITVPQTPVVIRTVTIGAATQCVVLVPSLNVSELTGGNPFTLTITYRNGCTYNLSNVFLKVILPPGTDFVSTNYPFFNRDANGISYNLGALPTNFQSAVSIEGSVSKAVNAGDSLIFSSVLNFNDEHGRFQSVSAYLTAVVGSGAVLGASVFGTIGNLLGNWLFDLLLLAVILFLVYWIFFRKRESGSPLNREEDVLEAKPMKTV